MVSTTRHIRTVLDVGPLTIDYIRNSKGKLVYRFEVRSCRHTDAETLATISRAIQDELIHEQSRRKQNTYFQTWLDSNGNRDRINAKRRERRGFKHKPAE